MRLLPLLLATVAAMGTHAEDLVLGTLAPDSPCR